MNKRSQTFYEREVERIMKEHALPEHYYAYIRQSKAFMEQYHGEKIELEEIAAAACMSRFHYIRIISASVWADAKTIPPGFAHREGQRVTQKRPYRHSGLF